jgi:hypothetical protein
VSVKTGGKPPRRSVPRSAAAPKATKPRKRAEASTRQVRTPEWDRRSSGRWTGGQAYTLAPGSEQGIARRRNTKKYVARTKRVIRPRIQKRPKADN